MWRAWRRLVVVLLVLLPLEYGALLLWQPWRIVPVIVTVGCWRYGCPPVTIGWHEQ